MPKNELRQSARCAGQCHPKSVLTDHEVDLLRDMHEHSGWGYKRLAMKFEIAVSTVRGICKYWRRA